MHFITKKLHLILNKFMAKISDETYLTDERFDQFFQILQAQHIGAIA